MDLAPQVSADGDGAAPSASGTELIAAFLPLSPFVAKLGIRADELLDDAAVVTLPWDPDNVTVGNMVHGGAIAALVDVAVMTAAWSGAPNPDKVRGVTVSLAIDFLAPAQSVDVLAHARVLRRGRSLVNVDVEVRTPDGVLVAKAIAGYKLG